MKYTMTQDTITVFHKGKPISVAKGAGNWLALRSAILATFSDDSPEAWEAVVRNLTVRRSLSEWARGKFTCDGTTDSATFRYNGEALPQALNDRIIRMAAAGESPEPLFLFWEKLQANPSSRSVAQLFPFLNQRGIPITDDGCFLAYKGVRTDLKDEHTGTVDNAPGVVNEMPRNKISDDPNEACHFGYHVGALEYARGFSARVVVCKVDPMDVVCVPYDNSQQKMRVCRYEVVGHHNGEFMADTTHKEEQAAPKLATKKDRKNRSKKFRRIHKMQMGDLMKQSIEDLRSYAANYLKLVGASKLPGGKTALVGAITKLRKKGK